MRNILQKKFLDQRSESGWKISFPILKIDMEPLGTETFNKRSVMISGLEEGEIVPFPFE